MPAVEDIAMYQVNPRVFAPDHSLNAVAERIDSIRALGVNVMWVMPIYPIGIEKGKNSPYCIKDYKAIAPEFGTIDDFKHLTEVCHEHGMGPALGEGAPRLVHTRCEDGHHYVSAALELGGRGRSEL